MINRELKKSKKVTNILKITTEYSQKRWLGKKTLIFLSILDF